MPIMLRGSRSSSSITASTTSLLKNSFCRATSCCNTNTNHAKEEEEEEEEEEGKKNKEERTCTCMCVSANCCCVRVRVRVNGRVHVHAFVSKLVCMGLLQTFELREVAAHFSRTLRSSSLSSFFTVTAISRMYLRASAVAWR